MDTDWVTMRHAESLCYADIPPGAVEAHRGLGWVPVDEWPTETPDPPTAPEPAEEPATDEWAPADEATDSTAVEPEGE